MSPLLISIAAFVGVAALVGGVAFWFRDPNGNRMDDRLQALTGGKGSGREESRQSVLMSPLDGGKDFFSTIVARFSRLSLLFDQADTTLTPSRFFLISGILALGSTLLIAYSGAPMFASPLVGMFMGCVPLFWLWFRRARRLKKFAAQLPDALELISRALRAGHSLAAAFDLVQTEMPAPIGPEFGRVFEEQNLGIAMDEALDSLTERVPNLDLRFFSTALILQKQTGGDLAEILDKIGYLIRERFKIWGQVQALTGEGRLSGIVLLALPPVLFLAVYRLNPGYCMMLFTDTMGKQMLAGAIFLQVLGALVIRKIVNIKV